MNQHRRLSASRLTGTVWLIRAFEPALNPSSDTARSSFHVQASSSMLGHTFNASRSVTRAPRCEQIAPLLAHSYESKRRALVPFATRQNKLAESKPNAPSHHSHGAMSLSPKLQLSTFSELDSAPAEQVSGHCALSALSLSPAVPRATNSMCYSGFASAPLGACTRSASLSAGRLHASCHHRD